jgi:hypothetical protein
MKVLLTRLNLAAAIACMTLGCATHCILPHASGLARSDSSLAQGQGPTTPDYSTAAASSSQLSHTDGNSTVVAGSNGGGRFIVSPVRAESASPLSVGPSQEISGTASR